VKKIGGTCAPVGTRLCRKICWGICVQIQVRRGPRQEFDFSGAGEETSAAGEEISAPLEEEPQTPALL